MTKRMKKPKPKTYVCRVEIDGLTKPSGFVFYLDETDLFNFFGAFSLSHAMRLMEIGESVTKLADAAIRNQEV